MRFAPRVEVMEGIRYARMDASVDSARKARTRAKSESDAYSFANLFAGNEIISADRKLAAKNAEERGRRLSFGSVASSISPRPCTPRHPLDKPVTLLDRRRESRDLSPVVDILRTGHYSCQQFNRSVEGLMDPRGDNRLRELRRDSLKRGVSLMPMQALGAAPSAQRSSTVHSHIAMGGKMRRDAIEVANQVLDEAEQPVETQIAAEIERAFDELHRPKWRCFVGRSCSYSLNLVHDSGEPYIHFSMGQFPVLLLKEPKGQF